MKGEARGREKSPHQDPDHLPLLPDPDSSLVAYVAQRILPQIVFLIARMHLR
jgi:hypothetical protein